LGGFCNGGIIAYEIARRLRQQGEVVHKVIMVAAANEQKKPSPLHRIIRGMGEMLGVPGHRRMACALWVESQMSRWSQPVEGGLWKRTQDLGLEILAAFRRFNGRLRGSPNTRIASPQDNKSVQESSAPRLRGNALYRHLLLIMKAHVPKTYSGKVLLLWPEGKIARYRRDSTLGWGRAVKQLEVRIVPGQHTTCLTTHAKDLAKQFREALKITTPE
jgi:thioesterase domain-containing protein